MSLCCDYLQYTISSVLVPPLKHFFPHLDCFLNIKIPSFKESAFADKKIR